MKIKDNFTPIPNSILEVLIRAKIGKTEGDLVLFIIRDTYGWQRSTAQISNGRFSKFTGLSRPHVIRLLRVIRNKQIIKRFGSGIKNLPHIYSLNENFAEWKVEFRGSDPQVTSDLEATKHSVLDRTKASDLEVTQEINKESKERSEILKTEIRKKHPFLRKEDSGG